MLYPKVLRPSGINSPSTKNAFKPAKITSPILDSKSNTGPSKTPPISACERVGTEKVNSSIITNTMITFCMKFLLVNNFFIFSS